MGQIIFLGGGGNSEKTTAGQLVRLNFALQNLASLDFQIVAQSRFFKTPCFPKGAGPDFVNVAVACRTDLDPYAVLDILHQIEAKAGRVRTVRWGQRVLDLDLLAIGDQILPDIKTYNIWKNLPISHQMQAAPQELILPHPRLHERAFVLVPMMDIAPDWTHPVLGKTIRELYKTLPQNEIQNIVPI